MLRNYLAAALRNLVRNRLTAAINIVGLAFGFAAALLIALFVRDELTFDTWIPGHENVYRLSKSFHVPGRPPDRIAATAAIEALWFKADLPEVVAMTRLWPETRGVRHGAVEANETVVWTDPEFFAVFPLPVRDGETDGALAQPNAVVITRAMARKYFGRETVVGEILEIDRRHPMRITAVIDDVPSRSHLEIGILASRLTAFSPLVPSPPLPAGIGDVYAYLRVAPGGLSAVQRDLIPLTDRHIPPIAAGTFKPTDPSLKWGADGLMTYDLQALADIHMIQGYLEPVGPGVLRPAGDKAMVTALIATGALILLIGVANFVNLMTARASRRAVEVGVRKVSGALRFHLTLQFVGESLIYVAASLIAAAAAVYVLLPAFNAFLGREIQAASLGLEALAAFGGLAALVGLLGGLYPALVMSGFHPASVLKSAHAGPGGAHVLRQVLVAAQFSILIALTVTTVIIARQTTFAMNSGFRLDTDQLVVIAGRCEPAFTNRLTALPGVRGTACAGAEFMDGPRAISLQTLPDGTNFTLSLIGVGPGLLELYGLKPLAGRFPADSDLVTPSAGQPVVRRTWLNETAMRRYGLASPEEAVGRLVPGGRSEIVGIVPDFPMRSLREVIEPTGFSLPRQPGYLIAKVDGARVGETLAAVDAAWDETTIDGRPILRRFYDQHVEARYADMRRQSQAFMAFVVTALAIAALGLFGLSAFTVDRRTKEMGIRKSMGASRTAILRLMLWQFTKPVLWANLIAWPAAYLIMRRWLDGFAYRIDLEPWMFLAASALALAIALATVIGHALMVSRARPVAALRYE